jgi:hypothetical protein
MESILSLQTVATSAVQPASLSSIFSINCCKRGN